LASPAAAPCAPLRAQALLAGLEPLEFWDANLSFWQDHLLQGPAAAAAEVLRGGDFFDPAAYVAARRVLEERLEVLSAEIAPGRYLWEGLEHPASQELEDSLALAAAAGNPLAALAQRGLAPRVPEEQTSLTLLVLESPGQWLGALVMGRWLKAHRQRSVVALVGDCLEMAGAPGGEGPCWDHALPLLNPEPLRSLAASLAGRPPAGGRAWPEAALPLGPYLSPQPVMSLRPVLDVELDRHGWRDPGAAAPQLMPVPELVQGMARQAGQGAAGFLLLRQDLPAAYLAELAAALAGRETPVGLAASLDDPPDPQGMAALAAGGVRLVSWRSESAGALDLSQNLAAIQRVLVAASRAGLWNHLELPPEASDPMAEGLLDFTGANPQVVHSWSRPELWPWSPRPRQPIGEPQAQAYRQVEPLPGRPLWRFMADPAHLLLQLKRHGREALLRWRVRHNGASIYRLGQDLRYVFETPDKIGPDRLEEIALLVLAAGKVRPKWLRHNLARAYLVGYAEEEGVIVGTDTLKRPREEYIASIKEQSGLDLTGYAERGYISIRPEYRGTEVSNRLIQGLISRAQGRKMVIITGAENIPAQKILARNGQRRVRTYHSRRLDKDMQIWMPREQDPELGEEE
jgi:GNAT superfamily N-acetyltransferase